jgi:hypothetical protein
MFIQISIRVKPILFGTPLTLFGAAPPVLAAAGLVSTKVDRPGLSAEESCELVARGNQLDGPPA